MKKKNLSLVLVMLALAGCGGGSGTGNMAGTSAAPAAMLAESGVADAAVNSSQFLMDAYQDGLAEVQLSQLALQKAGNNDVRNFAQRMVDDHTRMNSEMTQLAQSKNIALPTDLSPEQKALADRLATLSGDEFDRAYMAANVAAHEKDVAAARLQALQGNDPDVQALADASLPILEIHLALAEEINNLLDPTAFLVSAYRDGLAEIQLSQLALQRATSDAVKRFAQRMIDDHTQANNQLAVLAQQKGVTLPTALSPDQQVVADAFARLSGADFDKAYMDKNVVAHVMDVRQARQQSDQGRDPDVKNLAQQALPVLASHLASALDIDLGIEPSFLYSAFQSGRAEIQLASLALQQSANEQVKAFAQQMIDDHTAANKQISQLAQTRSLVLPLELSPEQLRALIDLLGKSGADFDRAYMDVNVQNHRTAVALATEQAQNASNTDIQSFAQGILPVLSGHLAQAQQLLQQFTSPAP